MSSRYLVKLSGALLVAGLLFNLIVTMAWHPSGEENNHPEIFAEYAASGGWVLTHFAQFLGVAAALAGLFVLCQALRSTGAATLLSRLGMGALIATVTAFGMLQAIDGITLKEAVDTWAAASGPEKEVRFADAETVRWTEWGLQSYFRILIGLSLLLVGAAILASRLLVSWLGWLLVLGGAASIAVGIDVGYSGLESGFQDTVGLIFQAAMLIAAIGVLVAGVRGTLNPAAGEARTGAA